MREVQNKTCFLFPNLSYIKKNLYFCTRNSFVAIYDNQVTVPSIDERNRREVHAALFAAGGQR